MMQLERTVFDYIPFPIGVLADAIPADQYNKLVDAFPAPDQFKYIESLGNKYSLSEVNYPEKFNQFVTNDPVWKGFHEYIKSEPFIRGVLKTLKDSNLKLGLDNYPIKQK